MREARSAVLYARHNYRPASPPRRGWRWAAWGAVVVFTPVLAMAAYEPGTMIGANNLSDVASAATSWTNLGGGTAGKKAASDNSKATVASVTGSITSGHLATFADTNGTLQDGGAIASAITALTGDVTASGPGSAAATLATVNTNVGTFGSSTAIPNFTVNGKGLVTAAGTSAVVAPAGTLSGNTLAAGVTGSSLTSVGTLNALAVSGDITQTGGTVANARVITAAGAVTVVASDGYVILNKTVGAATVVNLEATPATNRYHCFKDGKGDANANPITLTPAAGNIDGSGTFVMSQNYGSYCLIYNGTQWNVL